MLLATLTSTVLCRLTVAGGGARVQLATTTAALGNDGGVLAERRITVLADLMLQLNVMQETLAIHELTVTELARHVLLLLGLVTLVLDAADGATLLRRDTVRQHVSVQVTGLGE